MVGVPGDDRQRRFVSPGVPFLVQRRAAARIAAMPDASGNKPAFLADTGVGAPFVTFAATGAARAYKCYPLYSL